MAIFPTPKCLQRIIIILFSDQELMISSSLFRINRATVHSKNCGVKITPPVLIEDHTMHFTPVLNCGVSSTPSGVILTPLVVILTLFGVMFKL